MRNHLLLWAKGAHGLSSLAKVVLNLTISTVTTRLRTELRHASSDANF